GYSHGSIYYHFKDKAELFSAIIAHNFDEWIDVLNEAAGGQAATERTRLQELLLSYIRYGFEHKREYELMFVLNDPDLRAYSEEGRQAQQEAFNQAVFAALGLSGKNNPAYVLIPRSLFLSLHGFITYYLHREDTYENVEPQARAYARMLEAGLISMF